MSMIVDRVTPFRAPCEADGVSRLALVDDEDVVGRGLGDVALLVEHDRLEGAGLLGLDLREDVVQVVERLDGRRQGPGADPRVGTVTIASPFS
jgi:hypothetical protein